MAVDTSREAVERLSDEASFDGRQECADMLLALLARAEAAGAAHVTSQLALKQALDQRDEARRQWQNYEAAAVERQAQRDAAIAERDRLAEALGRFLNDAEPCRDFGEWFEACCKKASAALTSIKKEPTDGE